MMNPMTPLTLEQLRDLAPSYVLGLLDADERAAFDRGLQDPDFSATLEREMAAHRAAAEFIATAQPVAPPPGLKARMMERIAAEKRAVEDSAPAVPLLLSTAEVARQTPASRATRVVTPPMPAAVIDLTSRRTAKAAWWTAGVLGTALAASVIMAIDLRTRAQVLEATATLNTARIARAEASLAEREQTLQTLLAGRGNVVLVNLNPAQPAGPGMQVFWNVREGKAVVNAYGLAPVASDRAYMLWMIRDGKPVPLKLFTPGDDGRAIVASVELPTTTSGITLLAVTEESSAGANAPTMTPFLVGEVPAKGATP
jgi:anti-sigma-K factor RskA